MKVEPDLFGLQCIFPWCIDIILRARESPIPQLYSFVVYPGEKIFFKEFLGIPFPLSLTIILACLLALVEILIW